MWHWWQSTQTKGRLGWWHGWARGWWRWGAGPGGQGKKEDYVSDVAYLNPPQLMRTTNKHTCNLQVDVLSHWFGLCPDALRWLRRLLSCSWHQCCGIHAPQVVMDACSQTCNHVTWHGYKKCEQTLEGLGSLGGQAWINKDRALAIQMISHLQMVHLL